MVDIPILHGPFSHLPSSQVQEDRLPSLILWGPPGCGKTSFAHCVAGSTRCNFRSLRPRWRTGLVDTRIGQRLQKVMATLENLGKSRTSIYRKNKHTHTRKPHWNDDNVAHLKREHELLSDQILGYPIFGQLHIWKSLEQTHWLPPIELFLGQSHFLVP